VLGALVGDHGMLDLLEQGLGFRQRQPEGLGPQAVAFQVGHFLHHFGFAGLRLDNDLYFQPHGKTPLRVHPARVALGVLPKPAVHRPPVEAVQKEPLLPSEAVMNRFDLPRLKAIPEPLEQFLDAPRRGRAPFQRKCCKNLARA
jgi:hypothetical protein